MSKSNFESLLDDVQWQPVAAPAEVWPGLPYVTHSGSLKIGTHVLKCYQLNDGRRIFDKDEIEAFLGKIGGNQP